MTAVMAAISVGIYAFVWCCREKRPDIWAPVSHLVDAALHILMKSKLWLQEKDCDDTKSAEAEDKVSPDKFLGFCSSHRFRSVRSPKKEELAERCAKDVVNCCETLPHGRRWARHNTFHRSVMLAGLALPDNSYFEDKVDLVGLDAVTFIIFYRLCAVA